MQNGDFNSNSILEKNRDIDLDLKNPNSTNIGWDILSHLLCKKMPDSGMSWNHVSGNHNWLEFLCKSIPISSNVVSCPEISNVGF